MKEIIYSYTEKEGNKTVLETDSDYGDDK